ncbi:hypothetical protein TTHERM_00499460 (macronuclear) [Tetrahymena thermophila SB210]|uniref:Uncharacterized protein n=1 Tax=Tetrahymena thermophila (strain SB210) TaxID=312017 RepID=I7M9J5_TETTS|nr:hypothetical protein TTHERM_00499460 [Tetrahymena thermophila SB210]EAS01959.2 hypothetical protein TTHERM_00499460 [Tetrahymena thermophila SB210]|eukprot:XP_001022204.2 hypothetical protein TTHERM_00499460 [Tetrahymena thermophila SB210]
MSDDEDKSNTSHEEEEDDDDEEEENQSSEGDKSDEDEDEDKSGSGSEKSDEDDNEDEEDEDQSGSGSEKDDEDDGDSEKQSGEDSDSDSSKKKKKNTKKDTKKEADIIPKELQQKEELNLSELQKIITEVGSLQLEVDSLISTFSYETQQKIGYNPHKAILQNNQQGAFMQLGNTSQSIQNQIYMNNRNLNLQKSVSPPYSPYNTYGNYRFQKEQIQKENNQQQQVFQAQQTYPKSQQLNKINLGAASQVDQKQIQQDQLIQTQQSPIPRKGSIEEIAEMQAILARQQNKQIEQMQQNQQSKNQLPQQQSDQKSSYPNKYSDTGRSYQQHQEYKLEDNFGAKQSDRFRLNKESQSIIDNYYQNLYRKQVPHNRNYSNIEDLYKSKPKHMYDEDDLKKRSISPSTSSKDQKFMRNTVSQQNLAQGYQHNDQKIDQAIKVLLGKK